MAARKIGGAESNQRGVASIGSLAKIISGGGSKLIKEMAIGGSWHGSAWRQP
jgi:hypothetical protein